MIKLTENEKQVILKLNDPIYNAEYIEQWVNEKADVQANGIGALCVIGAKAYLTAVQNMIKSES